jgi:phosphoserine aminotransferase
MPERIFNFSSGPAIMPEEVLARAAAEIMSIGGLGMSVMELSHRSDEFATIRDAAENGLRRLLSIPDNYMVLFLQGGASLQFSMVPMNLLPQGMSADYVITGAWGETAIRQARLIGNAAEIYTSSADGYRTTPGPGELRFSDDAAYIHYTSNETIEGVEFKYDLDGGVHTVVCDASSNILSKPIDIEKYGLIYAGAQKNIGPSGVTVVIIRDDLLDTIPAGLPPMLDYRSFAENDSMPNTPNTWGIYLIGLVCEWLERQGGVSGIEKLNRKKAALIYDAIDASDGFYAGHANKASRSAMNVTFRVPDTDLETQFCTEAAANGMSGLKGHRSVGGLRASIYNAFPLAGAEALAGLMRDFVARKG